ncbi:MAG: Hsp20/alpha crystallin family protein [Candidatus Binataceae bacterium]
MAKIGAVTIGDFERAFDELFEELLISRWRRGKDAPVYRDEAVLDLGPSYEVRIALAGATPQAMDVEVTDQRLHVRIVAAGGGVLARTFDFPHAVDREAVTAKCAEGVLRVILPKRKGRRVVIG